MYNSLQQREVFHLEFLRWFSRKANPKSYALKGGVNMRFFFNNIRYSEDMDLDVLDIRVDILQDMVLIILQAQNFNDSLRPYGIEGIIIPDMANAKQTDITQRFKIHLVTFSGEDLFTKIEFSRRGMSEGILVQSISDSILRSYKLMPLIIPHYDALSAVIQKIIAVAARPVVQARDIFDLHVLSSQYVDSKTNKSNILNKDKLDKAYENLFTVSFEQFRDSVVLFLPPNEQAIYGTALFWDEVKLKVANMIEAFKVSYGE